MKVPHKVWSYLHDNLWYWSHTADQHFHRYSRHLYRKPGLGPKVRRWPFSSRETWRSKKIVGHFDISTIIGPKISYYPKPLKTWLVVKPWYIYLTDRKHRTKVNNSFSDFDFLLGVLQGSILGLLLINIYICDLFFFVEEDVTSYANDTTPCSNGKNVVTVLENIETKRKEVFNWFCTSYLEVNPEKSQLLLT